MNSSINFDYPEEHTVTEIRKKLMNYTDDANGVIECFKDDKTGIAEICINHAEKKNSITGKMMIELEKIVDDLAKWINGKGLIIHGKDGMFCSGGDLNLARKECNLNFGYGMATIMSKTLNKLLNLPIVSVAYIDGGGALGGGAEITTACDFRLMCNDTKTKIGYVHSHMGIIPAWGGCARLINIVGKRKALDLILSADLLGSDDAIKIGLVDGVVDNYEQAFQWLATRTKRDASITRSAKLSVQNIAKIPPDVIINESKLFAPLWGGPVNVSALSMRIKHK